MRLLHRLTVRTALKFALLAILSLFTATSVDHWLAASRSFESVQRIHDITATKAVALEKVSPT